MRRTFNLTKHNIAAQIGHFLFAYRNTPTSVTGMTPEEVFLSWKPRTKLEIIKPN